MHPFFYSIIERLITVNRRDIDQIIVYSTNTNIAHFNNTSFKPIALGSQMTLDSRLDTAPHNNCSSPHLRYQVRIAVALLAAEI